MEGVKIFKIPLIKKEKYKTNKNLNDTIDPPPKLATHSYEFFFPLSV
jgi:hypothetical protein